MRTLLPSSSTRRALTGKVFGVSTIEKQQVHPRTSYLAFSIHRVADMARNSERGVRQWCRQRRGVQGTGCIYAGNRVGIPHFRHARHCMSHAHALIGNFAMHCTPQHAASTARTERTARTAQTSAHRGSVGARWCYSGLEEITHCTAAGPIVRGAQCMVGRRAGTFSRLLGLNSNLVASRQPAPTQDTPSDHPAMARLTLVGAGYHFISGRPVASSIVRPMHLTIFPPTTLSQPSISIVVWIPQ